MVDVSPDDLVAATLTVKRRLPQRINRWGAVAFTPTPFSPIIDGDVLTATPWQALAAGTASGVELMLGHCRDEFSLLAPQLPPISDRDADSLIERLTPTPGAGRYRRAYPTADAADLRELALSDWLLWMPTVHLAEAGDQSGAPVWLYELRWGYGPQGASHTLDTLLVFGTVDVFGEVSAAGPVAFVEAQQLTTVMRTDHLAFATTGDPGWTRFRRHAPRTRVYDAQPHVDTYPEDRSRAIWSDHEFAALDLCARPPPRRDSDQQ